MLIGLYAFLDGCALLFIYIGVMGWWEAHTYRLRVDATGITERKGRKTVTVQWTDVASYSMEPLRGAGKHRKTMAPILKDSEGRELLQVHPEVGSMRERNLVRRFIESQVAKAQQ